jgi:N-methylhydantoinase B
LGKPTQVLLPTKKTNHPVEPGDVLTMFTSGGGGYGDPFQRDPELVARDVRQKLVSVESAARDYGVIVNPVTGTVDSGATARLRR